MLIGGSVSVPVIPMQFGVIFRTKEKLLESLYNNLEKFRKSLEFIAGRQEWGIKAFLNPNVFEEFLENGNEEILAKKREAESLPKGMAFFAKKQAASKIEEIKGNELARIGNLINENLSQLSVKLVKAKILEKDFTRMAKEMILNSFYLIEESGLAEFKVKAAELKEEMLPLGIEIEISGPWPSYHFA
ncbi:MAG: GvpL/GvpF family gas vesicle protein, partial [Bacteroidota bacterium]